LLYKVLLKSKLPLNYFSKFLKEHGLIIFENYLMSIASDSSNPNLLIIALKNLGLPSKYKSSS
jgi:hypothetical protein